MPIHDWSHVADGMFHWFHLRWVGTLCDWLNSGRLPQGLYAIGELYADRNCPDAYYTVGNGERDTNCAKGFGVAVAERPPKTRFTWDAETEGYLSRKDFLAIRSVEGILAAAIKIVSLGNKSSQARFQKFIQKTIDFLDQGVHVLMVDLFPPTPRDPWGIHHAIWSERYDGEFEFHPDKPLTLAAYMAASADTIPKAFVEPIALGESLPAMPLFLWPDRYINVELEETYQSAWAVYPAPLKPKIE